MKRFFLLLLLAFLGLFSAQAQTKAANAPTEASDNQEFKPLAKALLWRISGNGLATASYLYGTIHMIDKDAFFLDEETKTAIRESNEIIFEIDLEKEMNPMALMSLMPKMLMKDKSLSDLLSKEDYQLVQAKFVASGLPSFLLNKVKPMFVSMMLETPTPAGGKGAGSGETVSYEMEIMDIAKKQQKPISGLETAAYQMSMFDSIPLDQQADMLVQSIKDTTEASSLDGLVQIYTNRDINAMVELTADMSGDDFTDFLLVGRNRNWIPVIEGKMKEGPMFFAVGAGHLGASFGVINLLRKVGYTVEPIK